MPISNAASVVSFDAEMLREIIEDTVEGTLRALVEYNEDEFNTLYVDDVTLNFYEGEDHLMEHFEQIHSYVHLDFMEMDLFSERLFPPIDRVRFLATGFDLFTLLRIYVGDEGLFLAVDPDEPIKPLVEAIESALD